jgi:hypothetical protein
MTNDIREKAAKVLQSVPMLPNVISSKLNRAEFLRLTGTAHEVMEANWKTGGIMTACNGFVGMYGQMLGSTKYLGRFDLDTYLPKIGKGHTWVKSTKDARPKYGDICRHTAFHVGVSLDFDGNFWNHADAGQGGPKIGADILKRTRSVNAYDYKKLQGWIDIELYFNESSQPSAPVPEWLIGWWKVLWRSQYYYYYFDRGRVATWTEIPPLDTKVPPICFPINNGKVSVDTRGGVVITWNDTGSVEKFSQSIGPNSLQMDGWWQDVEPLSAAKM